MPDLSLAPPPARAELLRLLRTRLASAEGGLRILAEDILGQDARIDFVAVDASARVVLVLLAEAGGDLELVARGLAQRAWVESRLHDWLQLAPNLGLRPEAGAGLVLLCPAFGPESRGAAAALASAGPRLASYRCVRNGAAIELLIEPPLRFEEPMEPALAAAAPGSPAFRTGLTDAELGLSAQERREFE